MLAVTVASRPTAAAALSRSAAPRRPARRRRSGGGVVNAADVGFCRDKISERRVIEEGEIEGTSTIIFMGAGGQEVVVECPKSSYILDAGIEAGLELPYTCKGGICGCCVGRVAEGEVDQSDIADLTFVLTEAETESGISMLCMSRPVSDVVRIETQSDWGYNLGSNNWRGASGYLSGRSIDPLMGTRWGKEEDES